MKNTQEQVKSRFSVILVVSLIMVSLFAGGLFGYFVGCYPNSGRIADLQNGVSTVQSQLSTMQGQLDSLQDQLVSRQAQSNIDIQNVTNAVASLQTQLSSIQGQINALQGKPDISQNITYLQSEVASLQTQLSTMQAQITSFQATPSVINQNTTYDITYLLGENVSLSQLFDQVKTSVVIIEGLVRQTDFFGRVAYSKVQGSGFVYDRNGRMVVLTNNHVISGTISINVTFTTGETYPGTVLGSNANTDFAILTTNAPRSVYKPLEIVTSSTLKVGDPVIVVGTPYGLAGSMTNGIVSALNRTLTTDTGTDLDNVIQTTAPLNPGNSGGPLMNYHGQVIGITTAIVSSSQGIGFAIPSDTMLAEIQRMLLS